MVRDTTIVLVSCVKSKRKSEAAACDMYTSTLFQGMRRYAESMGDAWYILSAKYGVLRPEEIIAPYERTLNEMQKPDRDEWAAKVQSQLLERLPPEAAVIILAGVRYREGIVPFLKQHGFKVQIPMEGLKFGPQLHWLKQQSGGDEMKARKMRVLPVLFERGLVREGTKIELIREFRPTGEENRDSSLFRATIDNPAGLRKSIRWEFDQQLYSLSELTRLLKEQHGATPNIGLYFSNWQREGEKVSLYDEAEHFPR